MISRVKVPVPGPTSRIVRGSLDLPNPSAIARAKAWELGVMAPVSRNRRQKFEKNSNRSQRDMV
jgi:hypothetical protein